MARELPKRSEVKEEYTWDVSAMYASKTAWEADLKEVDAIVSDLAKLEGSVMASAEKLLAALELGARAEQKIDLAFNYAERLFDQDQKNTEHQAMSQKMYGVMTDYQSRTAFVVPEILAADKATLAQYFAENKKLELYRGLVDEILRTKEHVLSSEMEKLVAMTGEMAQTPEQVYSIINNADLIYPEIEDENGEKVRLSHGNFVPFEESGDRRVRKDAFEAFYSIYKQFAGTIAGLYNGQVKQQIFYAKARNYASTLEAAVDANNVPAKVYRNLVETVNANMDKMHRYVKLRKKCLGVDELHMYDVYTPMIADAAKKVSYDEAKETVLKALAPLGEDYVATVKEGFENRWIDVYENEGKRSGAYSNCVYGVHPYVLMSFDGTLDSVLTLAHEMGHSIHSWYSNANQTYTYAGYKIFVAEVASTCNEILILNYMINETKDRKEKFYLINQLAERFRTTLFRQAMFAEFETETYRLSWSGTPLTKDLLCSLYHELNSEYYGEETVIDEDIDHEWERIPHFYMQFYVYQYATGFSAAMAIARRILSGDEKTKEGYFRFLKGGCSKTPVELLKLVGLDMEKPDVVNEAMKVFEGLIKELEGSFS
mgnify:FL=1